MNIPSEFKSVTDYAVICGKRCQLFENFLRGRRLKNFEDCLCIIIITARYMCRTRKR